MAWSYQRDESSGFSTNIPEGTHRVRIKSAEKAVSKAGSDMLVIQMEVSGYNEILYHYIVFLADRPEITNRNLTQFFDSFKDIGEGDFNTANWIGKVGACTVKHEEYNGNQKSKVGYFVAADKQASLPAWKEPTSTNAGGGNAQPSNDGFVQISEADMEEIPF